MGVPGAPCCGIGELVLLDGDQVEESNFNRQILYRERDLGRPKAEAAADALAEFDSSCRLTAVARRLESVDAVREVAEGVDFVVNGADWPGARHRALGERRMLRRRRAVHHDEPLAAGRARRPAVRARHHRLLRVPGAHLPGGVRPLRRTRRPAPRSGVRGGNARPGLRLHRRPGGARDAPPPHRPVPADLASACPTCTTSARWR